MIKEPKKTHKVEYICCKRCGKVMPGILSAKLRDTCIGCDGQPKIEYFPKGMTAEEIAYENAKAKKRREKAKKKRKAAKDAKELEMLRDWVKGLEAEPEGDTK